MGGVDRDNVVGRVLTALAQCHLPALEQITVILGPHAPWRDTVNTLAAEMKVPTTVISGVDNMAELMASCDLAIGAGGTTTWERCSLGVSSVLLVLADNQSNIAGHMSNSNAAFVIDDLKKLGTSLTAFLESCELLHTMAVHARTSADMLDASGVARTIAELIGHYG